mgnify:FL=1
MLIIGVKKRQRHLLINFIAKRAVYWLALEAHAANNPTTFPPLGTEVDRALHKLARSRRELHVMYGPRTWGHEDKLNQINSCA